MKLSIIVPVYNRENYIESCLKTLLQIQSDEIEIIIVDDGSIDNSLDLCRGYEKIDKRINVYHKENGGVSSARNYGINHASGEYLMFVDSDDMICVETISDFMEKKWDKDIYLFDYYTDNGELSYCKRDLPKEQENENFLLHAFLMLKNNMIWNNIYKTSVVKTNNILYKESIKMGEDLLFNLEYANYASNYEYITQPLYKYNVETVGSALKLTRLSYIHDYTQIYDYLLTYYSEKKFEKYKDVVYFMNGIFMNLAGADYDLKHPFIEEFEKSQLYTDISKESLTSKKLKLKQWFIVRHIYRNRLMKEFVKKLFI